MNTDDFFQSSSVAFLCQIGVAILTLLSTLWAAWKVGAAVLGTYYLTIAAVILASRLTNLGLREAIKKRISEGVSQGSYLSSAALMRSALCIITLIFLFIFKERVNGYIGTHSAHITVSGLLLVVILNEMSLDLLEGEGKVGKANFIRFIQSIITAISWVILLSIGFGYHGLLIGYGLGQFSSFLIGSFISSTALSAPSSNRIGSLYNFSKYRITGSIRGASWLWMDTLILGLFVSPELIGIYEISWRVSSPLFFVASGISSTLLPAMSQKYHQENNRDLELLTLSLHYAGVIAIPGLIGVILLGPSVLGLFGDEYASGGIVLIVLVVARLFHCYQVVLEKAVHALDRPDLTFQADLAFLFVNVLGNYLLVKHFGWIGAAVATALSMLIMLIFILMYSKNIFKISVSLEKYLYQIFGSIVMGALIYFSEITLDLHGSVFTLAKILFGGSVYILVLLLLDREFRDIISGIVYRSYR